MQPNKPLIEVLSDLVSYPTVSGDNIAAARCIGYMEDYLRDRGMHVRLHLSEGFPSIVATTRDTSHPKVLLQAHLDVVPAPDSLFEVHVDDGKLVGRGVFDMKFAGAIFLKLIDELGDDLHNHDFGIMFTFDEEIGGRNGAGALVEKGYSADVCVLPDAGDNWQIEVNQKGLWICRLLTRGLSAHGSRPWEGDSAILRLIKALDDAEELFEGQNKNTDTLSINEIQGGSAPNQVPANASATLDIRFLDENSHQSIREKLHEIAKNHDAEIETIASIKNCTTDTDNPYVSSFLEIAEEVHGASINTLTSLGHSDSHYFVNVGIPTILLRPDGGAAHSDNEWIDIESLEKYYTLIKRYVEKEAAISGETK